MTIFVFATIHPKAESMAVIEPILREAVQAARQEEGCLRYDLYASVQGEPSFQFVEAYRDQAALIAHTQSAHYLALRESLATLLASAPVISINTAVDVAG